MVTTVTTYHGYHSYHSYYGYHSNYGYHGYQSTFCHSSVKVPRLLDQERLLVPELGLKDTLINVTKH